MYAVGIRTSICVPVESLEAGWRPIITHEASVSYRTVCWDRPLTERPVTELATYARIILTCSRRRNIIGLPRQDYLRITTAIGSRNIFCVV